MEAAIGYINSIVWSNALVVLCLGAGLYFSIATRFLQVRHLKNMISLLLNGKESSRGVSSFQALALSVSGRVGTGNIAGVATAIAYGGPGAVFWMWVIAFLGAGTAFIESTLAQLYKIEQDGELRGGPAYYIERGLKNKAFAIFFAISSLIAMGLFLPGIQSNSISIAAKEAFGISQSYSGILVCVALSLVIFGGLKRISHVAEVIVPLMAFVYVVTALVILTMNYDKIIPTFGLIISSALGFNEMYSGILGSAIAWGVKRGIYSNEAGQGTGPHAAAAAEVDHPAEQGFVQAFPVYIDTLFICTATALLILMTNSFNVIREIDGSLLTSNIPADIAAGPIYTQMAIESAFPGFGSAFVAIALLFFAFTTLMAYYYMAETNLAFLGQHIHNKRLYLGLKLVLLASVFYGSIVTEASVTWGLGDIGVGLMAWMNIIVILLLRKKAFMALKDYEDQEKAGVKEIKFDATGYDLAQDNVWTK